IEQLQPASVPVVLREATAVASPPTPAPATPPPTPESVELSPSPLPSPTAPPSASPTPAEAITGTPTASPPRTITAVPRTPTRDRLYGTVEWNGVEFTLVDTGGIGLEVEGDIMAGTLAQAQEAMAEADVIVLVADAQTGPVPADSDLALLLRRTQKPVLLAIN